MESVFNVDGVSARWLTGLLQAQGVLQDARVVGVSAETCGTGQLADSYRFTLEYEPERSGPETLVAKFASVDATSREFGRSSGYYRCEVRFYQELAPKLRVAVPSSLHAELADNQTDFIVLMEDLAPARQVDQLEGCSADESAAVLEQLAELHAASWRNSEILKRDWLGGPVSMFRQVTDNFAAVVKSFPELCGDLVADDDLRQASRLIKHADKWASVFSDPQCLWHSDVRADNVMFDCHSGKRPAVLLDWQGLGSGRGTIDVAYWLGTSMTVAERRRNERELVRHYRDALRIHGVSGYSAEQCWNDYRLQAIHGLQVGVFGLGAVKRTERGDRMWKCWIERCAEQVRDLESFPLLERT